MSKLIPILENKLSGNWSKPISGVILTNGYEEEFGFYIVWTKYWSIALKNLGQLDHRQSLLQGIIDLFEK